MKFAAITILRVRQSAAAQLCALENERTLPNWPVIPSESVGWEGWTGFFLDCVKEAADDAVAAAGKMFRLLHSDRQKLTQHSLATVTAIRLFDLRPVHPIVTLATVVDLLKTTKPTAAKAIDSLTLVGILEERTGRLRDRVYGYHRYLKLLSADTQLPTQ